MLGSEASVEAMSVEAVRAFFCEHYRPGNMVAAAAGDLDHTMVAEGLEARFGGRRAVPLPGVVPRRAASIRCG